MLKQKIQLWLLGIMVLTLVGCAGSGVTTRSYVEDKERVDQKMEEGGNNFGYIYGKPVAEDRSNFKKTRKIFVLEMTKEPEETPEAAPAPRPRPSRAAVNVPATKPVEPPEWAKPVEVPAIEEEAPAAATASAPTPAVAPATSMETYEVQKGDTLQKISKKFYDTYRKWQVIYEANQDTLKDPNHLKAGMVLKIPMEGRMPAAGENLK